MRRCLCFLCSDGERKLGGLFGCYWRVVCLCVLVLSIFNT